MDTEYRSTAHNIDPPLLEGTSSLAPILSGPGTSDQILPHSFPPVKLIDLTDRTILHRSADQAFHGISTSIFMQIISCNIYAPTRLDRGVKGMKRKTGDNRELMKKDDNGYHASCARYA